MVSSASRIIYRLEAIVQHDEGGRGLKDLIQPAGELEMAARALQRASSPIAILTGFPCLLEHTPPTETDGPPGALAIIRACIGLGKTCILLTDQCNAAVIQAAVAADSPYISASLQIETFPAKSEWTDVEICRLRRLGCEVGFVVAIERAGPARDGHYYTMRGRCMDTFVAPLEQLMSLTRPAIESLGIGDGGNELGMGKAWERIVGSASIPHASRIACVTATTWLLAASVSNWGGYALSCALAVVAAEIEEKETGPRTWSFTSEGDGVGPWKAGTDPDQWQARRNEWVDRLVPSEAQASSTLGGMVAAGARDGITGERTTRVDGMPGAVSLQMLRRLRETAREHVELMGERSEV